MKRILFSCLFFLCCVQLAQAQDGGFQSWLESFAQDAIAAGVSPQTVARVLPQLSVDESVVELDQKQPEGKITFARYVQGTLSPARIKKGRALLDEHGAELARISARFGVPAPVIVSLWGIESSFGHNMGHYEVLNSLATLAYEGRRADFFRRELIEALKIVEEEGGDPLQLSGSWAGAMGQCQFMPSTFRRYAVDWNGDGRRDIWNDDGDAMASIARYLAAEGWQAGQSWGREVRLTRPLSESLIGLEVKRPLSSWGQLGVRTKTGKPLPEQQFSASLIQPDGAGGRSFLVYDNFRALMRWNRSTYFATSVGLLADQLGGGR